MMKRPLKPLVLAYIAIIISCIDASGQRTLKSKDNSPIRIDPLSLQIVPPSIGVSFYRYGIVYLANTRNEDKMTPDHISFGRTNAYYLTYVDTVPGRRDRFSYNSSFDVPCDGMTFNNDYTIMYYTRKPSNKDPEKIYRASYEVLKGGQTDWITDAEPVSFCRGNASYTHPTLSPAGDMMVFASDREGSTGGFDLFISRYKDTNWSEPENAGREINSSGNEFSPFLDKDNNLYFSSEGHKGFGGYDIFMCLYNGKGWDKPVNLTDKINTKNDEIAFSIDPRAGETAYFTRRNRSAGNLTRLYRIALRENSTVNNLTDLSQAFQYLAMGTLPGTLSGATAEKAPEKVTSEMAGKEKPLAGTIVPAESKPAPPVSAGQPGPPATPPAEKQALAKAETATPAAVQASPAGDVVIYRVQFASYSKPKGSYEITVGGVKYKTYEYLYNGIYRACAGEFAAKAPAALLQRAFIKAGFIDAFVVAFKNNVRSLDPALFR